MSLDADVLIIGGGAAGCRAAIEAHDRGVQVLLAVKGRLTHSGSSFYPLTIGIGYTTARPGDQGPGIKAHVQEIMDAGLGMVSPTLARILAQEAPARLLDLLEQYRVPFQKQDGEVLYLKPDFGSGQVRAGGVTVAGLREALARQIKARDMRVLQETAIVRLLGGPEGCVGAVGLTHSGQVIPISARATVLATGGGGGVFSHHMNTPDLTFDGHSMALALGAELVNMEFYQMILGLTAPVQGMLIPETYLALQPRLTNGLGEPFLSRYLPSDMSPAACLQSRASTGPFRSDAPGKYLDIAIFDEVKAGRGAPSGGVQADFTHADPAQIRAGRLDWYNWAKARGVDLCAHPVEIAPHVHAFNGGVLINAQTETRVPHLFACGEAAGGPHGANRVGGNQFAGSQVFGKRAGCFAAEWACERAPPPSAQAPEQIILVTEQLEALQTRDAGPSPRQIQRAIQMAMWDEMGVHKDQDSLSRCEERLNALQEALTALCLTDRRELFLAMSLPHVLNGARLIVRAAALREESRGPHYRSDFVSRDEARFGQPLIMRREGDQLIHRFEELE